MKGRVNFRPIYSVEVRFKGWDYVSKNGIIFGNLRNELVMFGVQLSNLTVELLGMSVCDEDAHAEKEVMVCSRIVTWSEIIS